MLELRWAVSAETTTKAPRLQYRTYGGPGLGSWGEWMDVPHVAVPDAPQPASSAADMPAAPALDHRAVMQQALDALEMAHAGLEWYRDSQPEHVNGSDDEADEVVGNAMQALRDALGVMACDNQTR